MSPSLTATLRLGKRSQKSAQIRSPNVAIDMMWKYMPGTRLTGSPSASSIVRGEVPR